MIESNRRTLTLTNAPKEAPKRHHLKKDDVMRVICKKCGTEKLKIRSSYCGKKFLWRDDHGGIWNGNTCRDCMLSVKELRRRKKGVRPRSEVTEPRWVKAFESELIVKEWFEKRGFEVEQTTGRGPDLICKAGKASLTVEIKSAVPVKYKNGAGFAWTVGPVSKHRINDDLIAIVLPTKRIYFEDMKTHLLKCGRSRTRSIIGIVAEDFKLENKTNVEI